MGLNIFTLGSSKTYTRESLLGGGAVVGKNVTISSITPIEGGNRVTFSYTLDDGTVKTSSMNVMDGKDGIDGTNGKDGKDGQPGKDGSDGVGISKIEKISTVDLVDTYRITFTDNSTFDYEVTNGKDGQGGGTADVPIEKIKVNGELQTPVNKVVDITVPSIEGLTKDADLATVAKSGSYEDLINKPTIPSLDGYAKTSEIPTKVSQLENDSNYLSSIPEEYVTETELSAKGYLTEHQDISGKVDKVEGKSLIADTEIARLATVDNYDDTEIKAEIAKKADTTSIPSKVSELTNDSNYQTAEQVNSTVTTEIAKVVADAPENLNTLKEMSDWIAGHENDASAMNSAISDNKTAITALQTGKADKSEIPTTVSELTDSADYAKKTDIPTTLPANGGNSDTVNNHTVETNVPTNAVFTDTIYDDTEVKGSIDKLNSNLDDLENDCLTLQNAPIKVGVYLGDTGEFKLFGDYRCSSEYHEITPKTPIKLELNTENDAWGLLFYDENKTYLGRSNSVLANSGKLIETTTPANAKYVTFIMHIYNDNFPIPKLYTTKIGNVVSNLNGSLNELKNDLDTLEFGEVAGGKNIFDLDLIGNKFSNNATGTSHTYSNREFVIKRTTDVNSGVYSFNRSLDILKGKKIRVSLDAKTDTSGMNIRVNLGHSTWNTKTLTTSYARYIFDFDLTDVTSGYPLEFYGNAVAGTMYIKDVMFEDVANVKSTDSAYEPVIPSVKMLAEENIQQSNEAMDLKMLGWTVPKECPVQNYTDANGVFHQRVDRVDLGSLTWERYDTTTSGKYRMGSAGISTLVKKPSSNATKFNGYSSKYSVITSDNVYGCIKGIGVASTTGNVYVYDEEYATFDDVAVFKSAMSGVYLYYELATEITKNVDGNEAVTKANENLSVQLGNGINDVSWSENTYIDSSGNINSADGFHCSDLIQVTKTNYTYHYYSTNNTGFNTRVLGYDKNGNFKSLIKEYANKNIGFVSITFNIPNDVYFIRISEHSSFHDRKLVPEENLSTQVTQINNNLSVIGKCKNFFNAKLPNTTQNGVTCTNNGDGTYTVNGTAVNDNAWFESDDFTGLKNGVTYKIIGDPSGVVHGLLYSYIYDKTAQISFNPILGQHTFVYDSSHIYNFRIKVAQNQTASNKIFKPMLTTNLNATYDDFVPYTGDGETLYADVAKIKNDIVSLNLLASPYNSSMTYNFGAFCSYANNIYQCKTKISTPEEFSPNKWKKIAIGDYLAMITPYAYCSKSSSVSIDLSKYMTNYEVIIGKPKSAAGISSDIGRYWVNISNTQNASDIFKEQDSQVVSSITLSNNILNIEFTSNEYHTVVIRPIIAYTPT